MSGIGGGPLGLASLQLKGGERPLEGLGRNVALGEKGLGALAQVRDGGVAGVTQHAARIEDNQSSVWLPGGRLDVD
jgi:hypothetical protein